VCVHVRAHAYMRRRSVLGGARDDGEVCFCYFCSSSCQFLLTEARSAISIMYDCGLWGRIESDSFIKLEENKGAI